MPVTDNLGFLATAHSLLAANNELADMLDKLAAMATEMGLEEVPIPTLLPAKIASLIRANTQITAGLLEENEQISDGLHRIVNDLTNKD
jgi:hypothetical protein